MQTFAKTERLSSKRDIEALFINIKPLHSFPVKLVWRIVAEGTAPVSVLISVPKKKLKKAVDRNKIKRRIREAYRINKQLLFDKIGNQKLHLMIIYTADIKESFSVIERGLVTGLEKIHF